MNILLIFPGFIIAFVIVLCYEYKIRNLSAKNKNNVHFYVAKDNGGELWLYIGKPIRDINMFRSPLSNFFTLPCHIFDYLGLNEKDYDYLKWEDGPVEVFINLED